MPSAKDPAARDYPVRGHFRRKERDPKTGIDVSVSYDPNGDAGWPGAKAVFTGVRGSDADADVFDHSDGPLLYPIPEDDTSTKEN